MSPKVRNASEVVVDGRSYPLFRERSGTWRVRSRSRTHPINAGLGTPDLKSAKRIAKEMIEKQAVAKVARGKKTAEDLVTFYLSMPKRCGDRAAGFNVSRLRTCVRTALGKELSEIKDSDINAKLWVDYMTKRHAGKLDLSTRRVGNAAINAGVRMACSIVIPRLRPSYRQEGFVIAEDACVVQWLPTMVTVHDTVDADPFEKAWMALKVSDFPMWLTIGLARYAGLRRSEIDASRVTWVSASDGAVHVIMRDRPDEDYLTKTGQIYRAVIIHPDVADAVSKVGSGQLIKLPPDVDRGQWFEHAPQTWLKKFTGSARKPLHRMRGLYADQLAKLTEDAVSARMAGIKEASANLGHTNTNTTIKSYLTPQ